jgi:hypothetical protein
VREVFVRCGDVTPSPSGGAAWLALDTGPPQAQAHPINLSVEHITRTMVAALPPRVADLLEIACYVYAADQFSRREALTMPRMGEDWRRAFSFRIAVRDPDFWNSAEVRSQLAGILGFLSEDEYAFAFSRTARPADPQGFFNLQGDGPEAGFRPERIILFSGGLDSFAGATEALLRERLPVALISHHASKLIRGRQLLLAIDPAWVILSYAA